MNNYTDSERRIMAAFIREDNLKHANELAEPVTVKNTIYTRVVKRFIDFIVSGIILILTLPINLVIAVVTFFDVGRPIFFMQQRVGYRGKFFNLVKFRNMTNERDSNGELLLPKDRVTKWGRFVRRTSLDELLNFWSILKGDMSLIGPRPLLPKYQEMFTERHKMRNFQRPGLECPYLIPKPATGNHWNDILENDIWYVENVSFITDVRMLFALVKLVFNRKETKGRANANRGAFMGYDENGIALSSQNLPEQYINRLKEVTNNNQ